jgi:hypothetical protein
MARFPTKVPEMTWKMIEAVFNQMKATQVYWNGVMRYATNFMTPSWIAQGSFITLEKEKLRSVPPWETLRDYLDLIVLNAKIGTKGLVQGMVAMNEYHLSKRNELLTPWLNTVLGKEEEDIASFTARQVKLMEALVYEYPDAIKDIRAEYGFHFDEGGYARVAETDRFVLYQVLPLDKKVKVRQKGKPIIIVPPYVLGANILAFLPNENKSYVHCFANQGIPTYIRIVKDIDATPAVQIMTGEDDARDTRFFCEKLKAKHGKPVTLNGFCQGGFLTLCALLSGELDGLVDAHITCASPIDGTRTKSLRKFLEITPDRFRDLGYALRTLPNGNQVVDGKVMSWVYKLKSMENEAPMITFYRDLKMLDRPNAPEVKISKTAAAINYWLFYDQADLPLHITRMSFDSYTIPISSDGTLPVKLFDRELNLKRVKEQGTEWLICIAAKDDLVDRESALAPLDFVDAEVTVFPKGHASIATSWSAPTSECALHQCFTDRSGKTYRGPVCFQLDLEAKLQPAPTSDSRPEKETAQEGETIQPT